MSDLKVEVFKADGVKCPRCWRYAGIPELPQGICDRCAKALLESNATNYSNHQNPISDEDFTSFQEEIRAAYRRQYEKYRSA